MMFRAAFRLQVVRSFTALLMMSGMAASAEAATYTVNPTSVALSAAVTSRVLTVRNDSTQPLRFQLVVMAWGQAIDGEMELAPTKDVTVFPPVLSVGVGETRSVRVALIGGKTAAAHELTYRVFVEEMPPVGGPAANGVTMLTRVGVPIFVAPASAARTVPALSPLQHADGKLSFEIRNEGTVHFIPQNLRVRISSPDGTLLAEPSLNAWYILAGGRRRYEIDLSTLPPDVQVDVELQVNGTRISGRWTGRGR